MAKKKKSKFKKILKTLGKVAALGGAAYGASKLFGGGQRRKDNLAASYANVGDRHLSYDPAAIAAGVQAERDDWKKGGRVTGVAKRGFGRALMKGKK